MDEVERLLDELDIFMNQRGYAFTAEGAPIVPRHQIFDEFRKWRAARLDDLAAESYQRLEERADEP